NALINQKVSIVTNKSQTTRDNIKGIYEDGESQIIFVDTPGIHKPHHELGRLMNQSALASTSGVEVVVLVVDASKPFGAGDSYLFAELKVNCPLIIVLNKIDLATIDQVQSLKARYAELYPSATILEMSAIRSFNIEDLLKIIKSHLSDGPRYYPVGSISDRDEQFFIKELIREQVLMQLREEVPHQIAVAVEKFQIKSKAVVVEALIIVDKPSQKAIVIGKDGTRIKAIGIKAREALEARYEKTTYLQLYVAIKKDWLNNPRLLKEYGYK
ncbi:MAG: GTPase Era, partial [Candidatus Saccharimonadaceae bacterium]|nr:GTPase Era [Candidatus Saccharimonadaceae bacterium]